MSSVSDEENETAYSDSNEDDNTDYLYKKTTALVNGAQPLMLTFIKDSLRHPLKVFGNDAHELLSKPGTYIRVIRSPINQFDNNDTYIIDPDQFTDGDEIHCLSAWITAWTRYLFYINLDPNPLPGAKSAMEKHFNEMRTLLKLGFMDTVADFRIMMSFDEKVREKFSRDFSYYEEEEYVWQFRNTRLRCERQPSSQEQYLPPPYTRAWALSNTISKKRKFESEGITNSCRVQL